MSENEEIMNETENETMAAEVEAVETVETEAAEVEAADEVSAEEEAEVVEAAVDYDDEELMDKMQKAARLLRSRRYFQGGGGQGRAHGEHRARHQAS